MNIEKRLSNRQEWLGKVDKGEKKPTKLVSTSIIE